MLAPVSALKHYRRLQRLQVITLTAVRRAWGRLDPAGDWERQYQDDVGPKIAALVVSAQIAATRESDTYVAEVLNELAFGPETAVGVVAPHSIAGVTGDGRPVTTLLASSVGRARTVASQTTLDEPEVVGLESAQAFMDTVIQTILADTARAAEMVGMAQRPWVDGWVRMINPPCCARCAILSGKFYLFNEGFLRHPNCDCYHVPAPKDPEKVRGLIAINSPDRYFDSLTDDEQDQIFTKAGARAIREGADMSRVVNARRGMSKAQIGGRDVKVTTVGTARRSARIRLMPESIAAIAGDDREELVRLLGLYGYLS